MPGVRITYISGTNRSQCTVNPATTLSKLRGQWRIANDFIALINGVEVLDNSYAVKDGDSVEFVPSHNEKAADPDPDDVQPIIDQD